MAGPGQVVHKCQDKQYVCPSEQGVEERHQVLAVGHTREETSKVKSDMLLEIVFNRHFYQ